MFFCAALTCVALIVGCQCKKSGSSAVAQKEGEVVGEEIDVVEVIPAQASDKMGKTGKADKSSKTDKTDKKSTENAPLQQSNPMPAAEPVANPSGTDNSSTGEQAQPTENAPAAESESQSAFTWDDQEAVESESTFGHHRRSSSYYNCCTLNSCCVPAFNPCGCGTCETCVPACGPCAPACGPACGPCVPAWGGRWGRCGMRGWRSSYCNPCATICNPCAPCGITSCGSACDSDGCEGMDCNGTMNNEATPTETPVTAPASSKKSSEGEEKSGQINQLPAPTMSNYQPVRSSRAIGTEVTVPEEVPAPEPAPEPAPAPEPETK